MKQFSGMILFLSILWAGTACAQGNPVIDSLKTVLAGKSGKKSKADSLQIATASLLLGRAYNGEGNYDQAFIYLKQSLRIAEGIGDKTIQKAVYDRLSVTYTFLGNYPEAIRCYEKALSLAEQSGNETEIVLAKLSLGIIYKHQGNLVKALEVFLKALPYFEKSGNKKVVYSLDNCIGGIYLHQKEYAEAAKHLNSALEISRDLGMKSDVALNLSSIGEVYREQRQYGEALKYETEALKIYVEVGNKKEIAGAWLKIGKTYAAKGDADKALENFYRCLRICQEIRDNEHKAPCLSAIGDILIRHAAHADAIQSGKKYDKARQYFRESLDLSLGMGQKEQIRDIYMSLFLIDSATGNHISALKNYQLYERYKDSLNNIESINQLASLQIQFVREQKNQEIKLLMKENERKSSEIRWQKMQRNGMLFTTGLILLVGILIIRGSRLRKKLEKQQAVAKERERISADLHDDIGSGLSKIILMLEVLKQEVESPEAKMKAKAISEESLELSKNMSEVIWALNARNDHLDSLIAYIRKYAGSYFENSAIRFKMNVPAHVPSVYLSSEQRRNIFYVVKEALHNIVKHAMATEAEIMVTSEEKTIAIVIQDNGTGIPDGGLNRFGNGIIQMHKRLQSIGGEFSVECSGGTRIKLSLSI